MGPICPIGPGRPGGPCECTKETWLEDRQMGKSTQMFLKFCKEQSLMKMILTW